MTVSKQWLLAGLAAAALFGPVPLDAGEHFPAVRSKAMPGHLLWGDTHLHTSFSNDANMTGNVLVTPELAYRFARGEQVQSSSGLTARLECPLDFLVVADHVEYLGFLPLLRSDEPLHYQRHKKLRASLEAGELAAAFKQIFYSFLEGDPIVGTNRIMVSAWQQAVATADRYNDPGVFTAIPGYEWTSTPDGDNLHRIVLFREGRGFADQLIPFSNFDSDRPEDLWSWMALYEKETGGAVLAIPHNSNLSNGRMFAPLNSDGQAIDAAYATERRRREPIVEVTQIKGDSETHPFLSPNDEFADFWRWDKANLGGTRPKTQQNLQFEYLRSVLGLGLSIERNTGVNPFQFGMIGSTDAHTGLATADEDNFFGKTANHEPRMPDRVAPLFGKNMADGGKGFGIYAWEQLASGYAAVWAEENTREAIFAALQRREVYATTGPRIKVRFFGGWNFDDADASEPDYVALGYRKGIPMGGELKRGARGNAPSFLVVAAKDPDGANLDRVQMIKGWGDTGGNTQEKVYDIAWADGRQKDPSTGRLPSVGSTVDIAKATYTDDIGDAWLATVWRDPDFNPDQHAFYYLRVLEIPTPRWTAYDAVRYGTPIPDNVPMTIQERAYTSPIWYTPDGDDP